MEKYNKNKKFTIFKGCRVMNQCFIDGQKIRHSISMNGFFFDGEIRHPISIKKIWYAKYDLSKDRIVSNGKLYKSLTSFSEEHCKYEKVKSSKNGWKVCECEVNGVWISTFNL